MIDRVRAEELREKARIAGPSRVLVINPVDMISLMAYVDQLEQAKHECELGYCRRCEVDSER